MIGLRLHSLVRLIVHLEGREICCLIAAWNKHTDAKLQIAIRKNFVVKCWHRTAASFGAKAAANEISIAAVLALILIKDWTTFTEHKNSTGGFFLVDIIGLLHSPMALVRVMSKHRAVHVATGTNRKAECNRQKVHQIPLRVLAPRPKHFAFTIC